MIELALKKQPPYKVLCIRSHPDDIEIGCGGTVLKMIEDCQGQIIVRWVVLSATAERAREGKDSAEAFLKDATDKTVVIEKFEDSFFPYSGGEVQIHASVEPRIFFRSQSSRTIGKICTRIIG